MTKFLFIILFCFIASSSLNAQGLNVEQTIDYINKQLNNKDNKSILISYQLLTVYNLSTEHNWNFDYNYQVRIDHGLLMVTKTFSCTHLYHPDNSTYENQTYNPVIEELSLPINLIDKDYNYNTAYQNYLCNTQSESRPSYFIIHTKDETISSVTKIVKNNYYNTKKTEKISSLPIEFSNDNLVCEKLRNAFTHLLNLLGKDSSYDTVDILLDKDPFANSIKKDTSNSKGITTSNSNSIPMTKNGGVYEVPVVINEVLKLNFIFDAGAADVSISPDVALTLIRTGTLSDEDFLGTETYKFADGSTAKSKVFLIKEFQIGNKKVYNVRASISSSIRAPLLLGQSVLNKFGKVSIDYKNGVIIFQN